jgi:PIN domain nuclease of toxin-antitoxin system
MNILLDTQALILAGQSRLPTTAAKAYQAASNEIYFSLASLWEIGIKASLGKLSFDRDLLEYHDALHGEFGLTPLAIHPAHLQVATTLPFHHKDPFDRLLIGQALSERLVVMTGHAIFSDYGCRRIW